MVSFIILMWIWSECLTFRTSGKQVWGMISWKGPGRLVRIEGNLNADGYIALLEEHLFASVQEMGLGPRWIFQQVLSNDFTFFQFSLYQLCS